MSAGCVFPEFREDPERAIGGVLESGHAVVELEFDAVLDQVAFDEPRHLRVERRHDLVELLDQGHLQSAVDKVFHHLQANEPAADHHGALWFRDGLQPRVGIHPGRGLGAVLQPLPDAAGVGDGPQREDPGRSMPGSGGRIGAAPGDRTSLS